MASLACEFGVAESAIHLWKNDTLNTQAAEGGSPAELRALRQRLRELEMENQILKKRHLSAGGEVSSFPFH